MTLKQRIQQNSECLQAVRGGMGAADVQRTFFPDAPASSLRDTIRGLRAELGVEAKVASPGRTEANAGNPGSTAEEVERRLLKRLKGSGATFEELCNEFNVIPRVMRTALEGLQSQHYNVATNPGGTIFIGDKPTSAVSQAAPIAFSVEPRTTVRFGFVTDTHLCNIGYRDDAANFLYDRFQREGITTVFHAGNIVDGEAPFNRTELVVPPGFEQQIQYTVKNYPHRAGITTYYVAGDDHEGWYSNRLGIDFGRRLQQSAREAGRDDLVYLGYVEADVVYKSAMGGCRVRVHHPGGGSAYADSYMAQKIIEATHPGRRPDVLLYGHYHKSIYDVVGDVHTLGGGCLTDQSIFMRKKRLRADVGGWIVEMRFDEEGHVKEFLPMWLSFAPRPLPAVGDAESDRVAISAPTTLTLNY